MSPLLFLKYDAISVFQNACRDPDWTPKEVVKKGIICGLKSYFQQGRLYKTR